MKEEHNHGHGGLYTCNECEETLGEKLVSYSFALLALAFVVSAALIWFE